jgi:multidrug efflux pump subunit AcrB
VRDYYLEPESYARVNNQPSVSIYVQKENNANTVKATKGVMRAVQEYQKTLSGDVGIGVTVDQSVAIQQAISDVRVFLQYRPVGCPAGDGFRSVSNPTLSRRQAKLCNL